MTSRDLIRLALRWWWILILVPILGATAAYFFSDSLTPTYRAQITIVIEETQAIGGSTYNEIIAAERRTTTYSKLAQARPVLDEAIQRLGLDMTSEELADKISVSPIQDTQLITISATDPNPARAADIANTVGQVFIEQTSAQQAEVTGTSREDLQRSIDAVKSQIDELTSQIEELEQRPDANSASVQSEILALQTQLTGYQATYGSLLESQQRMDIAGAQAGAQLRIVEPAIASYEPVSPRTTLNTALGGTLGALLGGVLVAALGYLDNTIKGSEDVRRLTGSSAIGEVPQVRSKDGIEVLNVPQSPASEAYRGLRTNLQFASLGRDIRSIVVTSSQPSEGKSTTAANLATVIAQGGQRVILVDADLRKPRLHRLFSGLTNRVGLTNLLLAQPNAVLVPENFFQRTTVPGLSILTTGPLPPNPPDVLNSQSMRDLVAWMKARADIVVIDAPPMAVSDPLIIAGLVDGVLMVTLGKKTRSNVVLEGIQNIQRTGTALIGIVVNRGQMAGTSSYYRSHYESDRPSDQRTAPRRRFWRRRRDTPVHSE